MTKYLFPGLFLLAVMLYSCEEKTFPLPFEDEVDFSLMGTMDGIPIKLEAGKEGYYMHTRYQKENSGLWLFQGTLSPVNCLDCAGSFALEFRDNSIRPDNDPVDIPALFRVGQYPIAYSEAVGEELFRVTYQNQSSGPGSKQYQWSFGDGSSGVLNNPVHDYSSLLLGQSMEVCLEGNDASNCETQICNEVVLNPDACKVDFMAEIDTSLNYVKFESNVQGTPPFQYEWSYGDGYGSNLSDPGYFYQNTGRYQVHLQIMDANGCKATHTRLLSTDPALCTHNFTYSIERISNPDTLQLGHIRVFWWDDQGVLFRSDWVEQNGESRFNLLEVSPYDENELGQPTLRMKLEMDLRLSSGDHTIRLKDAEAFLGVALP